MTTYILGAGASRHAGFPLALQLGTALERWINQDKPADHDFRTTVAQLKEVYSTLEDFEQVLTDLYECPPGGRAEKLPKHVRPYLTSHIRQAVCEFFDDIRKRPAPLYERLAKERIRSQDMVVTFNYDVAVERALKGSGLWEIGDGYGFSLGAPVTPQSKVGVLKLHGSTNWHGLIFRRSTGFGYSESSLGQRPVIFFDRDFEYFGYQKLRDPRCAGISKAAIVSGLVMPVANKRFYYETSFGHEWEPFWDYLWDQAKTVLEKSNEIVIIGYSLPSADERARELLFCHLNRKASITNCCSSKTQDIQIEFKKHGFTHFRELTEPSFEGWLSKN